MRRQRRWGNGEVEGRTHQGQVRQDDRFDLDPPRPAPVDDERRNQHSDEAGEEQSAVDWLPDDEEQQCTAGGSGGDQGRNEPTETTAKRLDFIQV